MRVWLWIDEGLSVGVASKPLGKLHQVLLNRYARAAGYARDDYRKILEPFAESEGRRGRWQR